VQRKFTAAIVLVVVAALGVAALALGAARDSYKVSAALKPKGEVPAPKAPPGAKGTFTGKYVENSKGALLTWKLVFSGLSGKATAAHIHKGKAGVAGPVVVPLCGPCTSGMSGKVTISKAVIAALESGGAYVNVHTVKNAGGEIRAQVKVKQ
jgi:CHRD domain